MATLRLGVGDVFTVCKSVVDLCAKVTTTSHEEMKDVRTLVAEMEMMREHLSLVNQRMEKKEYKCEKDVIPLLTRSLHPIHKDLTNLHQTLQTHHHRKPSVHVLDQARYMLHYCDKLAAFKESIPRHRESISLICDIVESDHNSDENENENGNGDNTKVTRSDNSNEQEKMKGQKRRESIIQLASIIEREEMRNEEESYHQDWINQESLRKSIEESATTMTIIEEDEADPLNENQIEIDTPSSSTTNDAHEYTTTSFTPTLQKHTSKTPQTLSTYSNMWSKPAFRLDIFDAFSCTNTPRSSPPAEMVMGIEP